MSRFLQELMLQRRKFLDGLDANEDDISLDIFEDFYPDQAHFVFELLQNAEDADATDAAFTLAKDGCWFEHNGARAFTEADVRAITGLHNSTKTKSSDQIGKFGVGFKSVFVYTHTPTIYAADFSFQIAKYVMPEPIAGDPSIGKRTKFWLPFNNPKKGAEAAYSEIAVGLSELAETTLLFLPNIESIKWQIGGASSGEVLRIEHARPHVEVLKQVNGQTTTNANFLKFDQAVPGLDKQRVAIAFALDFLPNVNAFSTAKPLAQQLKIVPAPGQVAVFFPANKETSGLRFHLHAPFVPELSRASIKETAANNPLFTQLAALAAKSLGEIRNLGLLTTEFLGVLPNPHDPLGRPYECVREAIIEAMDNEPLTPTHSRGHAPAKTLYQAKASLKELLAGDDLEFLLEANGEGPQWAANRALQGTNAERFMNSLSIQDWDIEAFIDCIDEKVREGSWHAPDVAFLAWLSKKGADWHQQFYALLAKDNEAQQQLYKLKRCRIVRLADGKYNIGKNCHLHDDGGLKADGIKYVDPAVYTTGKSKAQQEGALKFLQEVGVTNVGERQFVEALLESRYKNDNRTLNQRQYPSDIRRFIKLLDEDPSCASLLSRYLLFMASDNKWHKPADIYLDAPHLDTGLGEYFGLAGVSNKLLRLADFYQSLPIDAVKITRFAEKLGCATRMTMVGTSCSKNPQWSYLSTVSGERYTSPIDRDYLLSGFPHLAAEKSERLSKLVWATMCALPVTAQSYDSAYTHNPLHAVYQKNERGGARVADSLLVHQLRSEAWVPQKGGEFVRPAQARAELLPDGFTFDSGWAWIKAIQFGKSIQQQSEKAQAEAAAAAEGRRKQQEAAKALGFDDADTARRLAEIPAEELNRFYADWERRKNVPLPEHEPANPERRSNKVFDQAVVAAGRRTEERIRSVSIGREEVKGEADQYLRQQYTNEDTDQICQICKDVLPFKLDSGVHFFEAVLCLAGLKRHHPQNYLCLCPNHSAMFMYANGSKDRLKELILQQTGNELGVILAQQEETIYFTKMHLADLRSIIAAEDSAESSDRVPQSLAAEGG